MRLVKGAVPRGAGVCADAGAMTGAPLAHCGACRRNSSRSSLGLVGRRKVPSKCQSAMRTRLGRLNR